VPAETTQEKRPDRTDSIPSHRRFPSYTFEEPSVAASPRNSPPPPGAVSSPALLEQYLPPPPMVGSSAMGSNGVTFNVPHSVSNGSRGPWHSRAASPMSPLSPERSEAQTPKTPGPGFATRVGINTGANSPVGRGAQTPTRSRMGAPSPSKRGSSRIDPEHVPRPVGQPEAVKEEGGKVYETTKYNVPPPASAVCRVVDRGSCSCQFMRCTVNQVPAYPATANTAHVPIAVICQPFAELSPLEASIPLIDMGEAGPLRCSRCKAYVNPFFQWGNHGREVVCNLCGHRKEVPGEYFSPLDQNGRRRDHGERPELLVGTVDYIAPRDYSDITAVPPAVMFVIEASARSVQSGFFHQILLSIKAVLRFLQPPASRVGIITFDSALQFYAFHPGNGEAQQIIVGDIEDPFHPCGPDVLIVDTQYDFLRRQFEALLDKLPNLFKETRVEQVAGGAALKVATEMLGSTGGGSVLMFQASLPTVGIGALRARNDLQIQANPEEEAAILAPQQAPFFDSITKLCLEKSVGVTTFCAPTPGSYVDAASLSVVPRKTGGEFFFVAGYDFRRDSERLHYDITRAVMQGSVYGCIYKLRCSKGVRVEAMYAPWDAEVVDPSTFQVARMTVDATAVFLLQHVERMEGSKHMYMQGACLHTDKKGRRLIRVQTLQLPVTSSLSNVFRFCEIDTVTNVLMKQSAVAALTGSGGLKDRLTKSCVDMLHAYRVNCASTTSSGQLILPESLKLLPLYVGSIRKMMAFRTGPDVRADDKAVGIVKLLGLPMWGTAHWVYPRVYPLTPLSERAGRPTGVGQNVYMPPMIACSFDKLMAEGLYLVDNGAALHLYICSEVSMEFLHSAFGVTSPAEVPYVLRHREQAHFGEEGERILAIVEQIRRDRPYPRYPFIPLYIVIAGTPEESRILTIMAEDRLAGEMHYVDFLCQVHKFVQNKLDPG